MKRVDEFIKKIKELVKALQEYLVSKHKLSNVERTGKNWKEHVSDDLEKAANHYLYSNILYDDVYVGNPTEKDCIEMFKAGAKWQKEKMMAKAINTEASFTMSVPCICISLPLGVNVGDKVKVIVIKEETK